MSNRNFGDEMRNIGTNNQRPTFNPSKAFYVSYVSLKWILLTMIHYEFPELFSHEDITTQAFWVIEFFNLCLLRMVKSTDKEVYWVIWFIFQLFGFEFLLWMAVYPVTSVVVNLCLVVSTLVKLHDSDCLWSRLKEIISPLGDEPFSEVDLAWF